MKVERNPLIVGCLIAGIGIILSGVHFVHGIEEVDRGLPAVFYGVALPMLVSFLIVGSGYWIARNSESDDSHWRLIGWCVGGVAGGLVLIGLLIQYQAAEGVSIDHQLFVYAMFGTYGAGCGILLGWYDVQRMRQHIQQIQKTKRLEEFANIVSHDLRNPLNVARGRLRFAIKECESDHLQTVERSHARMEALIDDLLTLAREGDAAIEIDSVDLADIVNSSWRNVETADATILIETDLNLRADPNRLQQLFENLFRNAVDHSNGDVTITVGTLDDNGGFYVEDNGPGIPVEQREQIFNTGYSTTQEGTGFGLSIVKSVVEAHGWEIRVVDGAEGGARFEITEAHVIF